jgi:hypothetical protein
MTVSTQAGAPTTAARRDIFLSIMAVLLGILAISDFTKALQHMRDPSHLGLVIFGIRVETVGANLVAGPIFGLLLATYAYGIWTRKRWALGLGIAYAFYVPFNLVLFWFMHLDPRPPVGFIVFYLFVSLTGSVGTALYLAYHREQLG